MFKDCVELQLRSAFSPQHALQQTWQPRPLAAPQKTTGALSGTVLDQTGAAIPGATNVALGSNDIASVTVTSNAYNASFGDLCGAQVSEISRSGSNKFHGNTAYWWNGRVMDANDFFNKNSKRFRKQ